MMKTSTGIMYGKKLLLRTILILLVSCSILSFVCCSKKQEDPPVSTDSQEEETQYMDAVNYNKEFIILSSTVSDDGGRHFAEFNGDCEGDNISAQIFRRDSFLEEKYNVDFVINQTRDWNTEMEKAYLNDTLSFHVATPGVSNIVYSITKGLLADLNKYPNFDFSREWWATEAIDQMSVIGKRMIAMGDINLLAYDSVGVIFYNKKLASDLDIVDLYDQVETGNWTYAQMLKYVARVTTDSSGDGIYGAGDTYGLCGGSYSALCFMYGANFRFVEKDEDGIPTLKSDLSNAISFFQDVVADHALDSLIGYDKVVEDTNMFAENRLLFSLNMLGYSKNYRDDGVIYGILPLPKYDTNQKNYYTFPHQSASTTICIPILNHEYDMTSRILEDMAYLSRQDVLKCYIEENLYYRSLDGDKDSFQIVLNLLQNLNCDIFFSYRAGITEILRGCMDTHNTNVKAKFEKYSSTFQNKLGDIVAGLLEKN